MAPAIWRRALGPTTSAVSSVGPATVLRRCLSGASTRRFAALWGNGDYGRLGLGSLESRFRPTLCPFFDEEDPPASIACGGSHTLFLTESGCVFATGLNNFGQLGITSDRTHTLDPVKISGLPEKVKQISAGYYHSSAITDGGELFIWGNNSNGQLGLGRRAGSIVSTPTRVDSLVGINIKNVALGSDHSIAITDEGNILSWGAGRSGKLGHGHQSSILGFSISSRMIAKDQFMQ